MTLREAFEQFCENINLPMAVVPTGEAVPDHLGIIISGDNGDWDSFGMCFEEENLFVFYVDFGIQVPKEAREQVCAYLNQVNYQLKFGGFFMDSEGGHLMARASQLVFGSDEEKVGQVENTVKVCAVITDAYYKEIMQKAFTFVQ